MPNRLTGILAVVACCCAGCGVSDIPVVSPPPAEAVEEPVGLQILRAHPELKSQRFINVLSFEDPADTVFLGGTGLEAPIDSARAHTGHSSVRLSGGRGVLQVKLSSAMGSRPFPGEWTLVGAYLLGDRPAQVQVSCEIADEVIARRAVTLRPGEWTAAMVDLAGASNVPRSVEGDITLSFSLDTPAEVWCDDVILIDNTRWILGGTVDQMDWRLGQRGFSYLCASRGQFTIQLPVAEANPAGWAIEEANALRARFRSNGPEKSLTIYPDGRAFRDGQFSPLTDRIRNEPLWAQQQQSPAQVQVPQTMGRLNRNSSGDLNNDGYNEQRGAYPILATGPRLEASIIPRTVPVLHPVLEISGLPPGKALVTVEGSLVQTSVRLGDGTLLVELPIRVDRAVTVNVRVQ